MREPLFFPVPANTPPADCRWCWKRVYWITTARGRPMPVDVDVDGGIAPTASESGRGLSHFATCPNAPLFRGSSPPRRG